MIVFNLVANRTEGQVNAGLFPASDPVNQPRTPSRSPTIKPHPSTLRPLSLNQRESMTRYAMNSSRTRSSPRTISIQRSVTPSRTNEPDLCILESMSSPRPLMSSSGARTDPPPARNPRLGKGKSSTSTLAQSSRGYQPSPSPRAVHRRGPIGREHRATGVTFGLDSEDSATETDLGSEASGAVTHPNFAPGDYINDDDELNALLLRRNASIGSSLQAPTKSCKPSTKIEKLEQDKRRRQGLLSESQVPLDAYPQNGIIIFAGMAIELQDDTFLKVAAIIEDMASSKVVVRGQHFRRVEELKPEGWLETRCNEVCWLVDVDEDDTRDFREQSLVEVPIEMVARRRRLILTNYQYPDVTAESEFPEHTDEERIASSGFLVCRLIYSRRWPGAKERLDGKPPPEVAFIRIPQQDADPKHQADDNSLRSVFRGETVSGGDRLGMRSDEEDHLKYESELREEASGRPQRSRSTLGNSSSITIVSEDSSDLDVGPEVVELVEDGARRTDPVWQETSRNRGGSQMTKSSLRCGHRRYTFGDGFCGCGGMTRSAVMAGLHPAWGFDFNLEAVQSYRTSFPYVRVGQCDAHDFATNGAYWEKVDILHASPPCQFYSPAHTTPGKSDEKNTAASFVIGDLLTATKPRIVTIEETFGLNHNRHEPYLQAIVKQFTSKDFSVRWKTLQLVRYGVPQTRKRLLLIASW